MQQAQDGFFYSLHVGVSVSYVGCLRMLWENTVKIDLSSSTCVTEQSLYKFVNPLIWLVWVSSAALSKNLEINSLH